MPKHRSAQQTPSPSPAPSEPRPSLRHISLSASLHPFLCSTVLGRLPGPVCFPQVLRLLSLCCPQDTSPWSSLTTCHPFSHFCRTQAFWSRCPAPHCCLSASRPPSSLEAYPMGLGHPFSALIHSNGNGHTAGSRSLFATPTVDDCLCTHFSPSAPHLALSSHLLLSLPFSGALSSRTAHGPSRPPASPPAHRLPQVYLRLSSSVCS